MQWAVECHKECFGTALFSRQIIAALVDLATNFFVSSYRLATCMHAMVAPIGRQHLALARCRKVTLPLQRGFPNLQHRHCCTSLRATRVMKSSAEVGTP